MNVMLSAELNYPYTGASTKCLIIFIENRIITKNILKWRLYISQSYIFVVKIVCRSNETNFASTIVTWLKKWWIQSYLCPMKCQNNWGRKCMPISQKVSNTLWRFKGLRSFPNSPFLHFGHPKEKLENVLQGSRDDPPNIETLHLATLPLQTT